MNSLKRRLHRTFVAALFLVVGREAAASPDRAFPHESSDLAADPRVVFGRLENGLRYAILPHPVPPGAVSLRLHVEVGSYHEEEDERGYAHLVEHMVFNGTRDFPGRQVVHEFHRLGARLGEPDTNAVTSRFSTSYFLNNLPAERPETLERALLIFRNFADGALLEPKELAQERRVVLAEGRSAGMSRFEAPWADAVPSSPVGPPKLQVHELEGLFDETRLEHRRPHGSRRAISRATSQTVRAFYERWYRPERMLVVVAGDVEPGLVADQIARTFASFVRRTPVDDPTIVAPRTPTAPLPRIFGRQHRGQARTTLTFATTRPRPAGDTTAGRRRALARNVALDLLTDRISQATTLPVAVGGWISHEVPGWELVALRNQGMPDDVTATAVLIDTELRRALVHGFSAGEFEAVRRRQQVRAAEREAAAARWSAARLAQALAEATAAGYVFTSPADDRRRTEAELGTMTADDCHAALRDLWAYDNTHVLLFGPGPVSQAAHDTLRRELEIARAVPVVRPAPPPEPQPFPYTDFGPPGVVTESVHDAELDCWFVRFANGVRLAFKPTELERGWAHVRVRFGDGRMAATAGAEAQPWTAMALMRTPLRRLSTTEAHSPLLQLSFPRQISLNFDHFAWSAELPAADLSRALQLATATLEDSDWDSVQAETVRAWLHNVLRPGWQSAGGVADRHFREGLHPRPEFADPGPAELQALPLADGLPWLRHHLEGCAVAVTIVGDLDRDDAVAAVARTLAALSDRRAPLERHDFRRAIGPATAGTHQVRFEGDRALAATVIGWSVADAEGPVDDVKLSLLARILDDRIDAHIREELGLSYSPSVGVQSWREYTPAQLVFRVTIQTAPRDLRRATTAAHRIINELVREGVAESELENARRPLLRQMQMSAQTNAWWLDVLHQAHEDPGRLSGLAHQRQAAQDCTAEELTAFARRLLDLERAFEVAARPR